jgi:hypothetical protein
MALPRERASVWLVVVGRECEDAAAPIVSSLESGTVLRVLARRELAPVTLDSHALVV